MGHDGRRGRGRAATRSSVYPTRCRVAMPCTIARYSQPGILARDSVANGGRSSDLAGLQMIRFLEKKPPADGVPVAACIINPVSWQGFQGLSRFLEPR